MATCKLGEKGCWKDGKCHYSHDCENKVLTNADHIRAMSEEELAQMLVTEKAYGVTHEVYYECPCGEQFDDGEYKKALEYTIAWLKQPVEE